MVELLLMNRTLAIANPDQPVTGNLKETNSKRSSDVRLPLPVQDKGFVLSSIQCPTTRCYCQLDSQINRYIINCRHQRLAKIPTFTAVDTIFYEITFSMNNYITEIPHNAFGNLRVERIDLLQNSLESVLPGAFTGLEGYLKELLIEGNGNILPPYSKISNLVNLRMLRMQKFQQYTIEQSNYFDRFPYLEVLELHDFLSLTSIDGMAFQNKLPNLQRLDISNCNFTNIPVQSLIQLQSLQKLNIKDSKITTIYSKSFEQLHNLNELDISYNKITTLETDAFQGIEDQLESLSLTFNDLTPESMTALSGKTWLKLEQLTLSYNTKLGTMPEGSFRTMPVLQYLNLVQINLRQISKNFFAGLQNLHTLDLSWNKLERIEAGAFEHMPNLYELKLNKQFGSTVIPLDHAMQISPLAFHGLEKSLAVLNLQDTPVVPQQFWNILTTLANIETLKMSKTRLSKIPNFAFVHNTKLKEIELEENDIESLTADSFTGPSDSLQTVLLNFNNISSISSCVFDKHTKLEAICLAQNPLNCDCNMFWLYKLISRLTFGPCFKHDYVCSAPKQYENEALYSLLLNETCSGYSSKVCIHENLTTTTHHTQKLTTITEDKEVTTFTSNAANMNEMTLTVVGKTPNSITLAWNIDGKTKVTGFILQYRATTDNFVQTENIPPDEFLHTIYNLKPGLFYTICVNAEINHVRNNTVKACTTTITADKEEITTTTANMNEITLTIAGKTPSSITLAWNIKEKSKITGFILEYQATADNFVQKENIHRDEFLHTIYNLKPGLFYRMCIIAEINQVRDNTVKDCRTTQTESQSSDTEKQADEDNNNTNDDINARNVLIGAVLGTTVVIILVITGLYLIVKYKVQKLKTLRLTLDNLQQNINRQLGGRAEKICSVDNEYIEMEEMKKANRYTTIGGKYLQRQNGASGTYMNDSSATIEVNEMEAEHSDNNESDTVYSKDHLEQRHSAPSRLNAADLLKNRNMICASRPLPATPSGTVSSQSSKAVNVITTQVSVYDTKDSDSVYQEISSTEPSLPKHC